MLLSIIACMCVGRWCRQARVIWALQETLMRPTAVVLTVLCIVLRLVIVLSAAQRWRLVCVERAVV